MTLIRYGWEDAPKAFAANAKAKGEDGKMAIKIIGPSDCATEHHIMLTSHQYRGHNCYCGPHGLCSLVP